MNTTSQPEPKKHWAVTAWRAMVDTGFIYILASATVILIGVIVLYAILT